MTSDAPRRPAPAVVVGLNHYIGLQTARILHSHGVPVIGMLPRAHPHRLSRCVDECVLADTTGSGLIAELKTLGKRLEQPAVLVPCLDVSMLLISRHRVELRPYFRFALPDRETVELLAHKTSFHELAKANDMAVPETRLVRSRGDALESARTLRFPVTLKPALKTPGWEDMTPFKALQASTADELMALYEQAADWADVFVVQEWIPGDDSTLTACYCYFPRQGPPLTFTSKSIRKWRPYTGNTSLGQEICCPTVEEETVRLFTRVGFHGLGYLEMKRDERDGRYYVIEPNVGRPTGKSALADACGVPLLYTMYCELTGAPLPDRPPRRCTGVKWIDLRHDFNSAFYYWRRGELGLRQWWSSVRGKKVYAVWSRNDMLPFLATLWQILRGRARRVLARRENKARRSLQAGPVTTPAAPPESRKAPASGGRRSNPPTRSG